MIRRDLRPIHRNIRRLRLARGWTQSQLGDLAEADRSMVCHWENGRSAPNARRLLLVAKALDVSIDDLMTVARYGI